MNILFIAPRCYPDIGGVERHILEVGRELVKDGHTLCVIVLERSGHAGYEEAGGVKYYRLDKNKRLGKYFVLYQMIKLWSLFREADIIHFHDFFPFWKYGTWLFPFLKAMRKKVYITFHGWEGRCPPERNAVIKRKICEKLANGNMCIGHFIEKWYGCKADVVSYGGVRAAVEPGKSLPYVVFVGRLAEDSGITEYVRAWKQVSERHPKLKFVICGGGALRESLEEYIERENIGNIEFKGVVIDPENYVKYAHVVFTSGFLGILEAFSYKKPVIGVYRNELKKDYLEMLPESDKMLWIAGDSGEVANSVEEALSKNEKVERAYAFSLANDWDKVKRDYYKLWRIDASPGAKG